MASIGKVDDNWTVVNGRAGDSDEERYQQAVDQLLEARDLLMRWHDATYLRVKGTDLWADTCAVLWPEAGFEAAETMEWLRARVAELERERDIANAERDDWRACAQSATPGGSEYTDPAAVSDHIRRLKDDLHAAQCAAVTAKGERDEARRLAECYRAGYARKMFLSEAALPPLPWESGE